MGRYLCNSSRPTMMATGCQILLCVVLYSARSWYISQEKWVGSEFACFVRLSIVFFECYFKPFLCLFNVKKPKKILGPCPPKPPPGPCHEPARRLTALPPDPQLLFVLCVSCSYSLCPYSATNVDFLDPQSLMEGSYKIGSVHPSFSLSVSFPEIGSLVFSET